jgi:hypothetical protein
VTYPQQGGPQQQGGYGHGYPQPGGYGPPPPNKPKTGLIVGIVASVVVVALGLVLVLALTGDDDDKPGTAGGGGAPPGAPGIPDPTLDYTADDAPPGGADSGPGSGDDSGGAGGASDPQTLAQTVARIFETHDAAAIEALGCNSGDKHYLQQDLAEVEGNEVTATAVDVEHTTETLATATIQITPAGGQPVDYPIGMQLLTNETEWCVRHR